jgi:hypothetical protein
MLARFLGLWCHVAAEVAGGFHRVADVGIGVVAFGSVMVVGWGCFGSTGLKQRLLPLFLVVQNLNSVLELRKYFSFSVYVLPPSFGTLDCYLPPHDGLLFLTEPFNLLLDSEQLLLFCGFFIKGFFLPVWDLDLFDLSVSLNDLYWQRCPRG